MNTRIRFMEESDISVVVYNDRRILGQSLGEETLKSELNNNPFAYYFVMENPEDSAFLGHVSLWIDSPMAQILNIYVIPELQSHGLGSVLMDFVLEFLKQHEVSTLTLEVRQTNTSAQLYYKKYGFTKVAIRKQYYENGEDADLMLKNL
ncbi:MAG: ribosomal-protein-alanine N-acetyltransferase [Tenericutes bacterium HGW-Tenericutes-1]|nr:MAG: ribosomal-protein-alanine N-acetyltransferase [Tenericutes bacterium HGW-Tenericutes-1]